VSSTFPSTGPSKTTGPRNTLPVEIEGFTEEERQEITSQIDQIARSSSMGRANVFEQLKPEKKGTVFPLVVNLLALVIIAAGVYLSYYYFNQRLEQLNVEANAIQSAEGQILEEVKRDAERKIQEKESEISKIREDLALIEEQRRSLQDNMQQQISAKEQELQRELETILQAERSRLQASGISQQELDTRLEQFRTEQEQQFRNSLTRFREQSMEQLQEKEEELIEAKATAEKILQDANREKEELLAQSQEREAELRRQFEAEKERLAQESSESRTELRRLEDARQNEQLFRDQINGLYIDIQSAIDSESPEQARGKINELRTLLQSPSVRDIPSLAKRIEVDSFMIDLLETEAAGTGSRERDGSLLEAAKKITALNSTVDEAQRLQSEGKLYDARRYYSQAIEMLPAVQTAVNESRSIVLDEEAAEIKELIAEADQAVERGDTDGAVGLYTNAALEASREHSSLNRTAVSKILQLKQQELAEYSQRSAAVSREIETLREEIRQAEGERDALQRESTSSASTLNRTIAQQNTTISDLQNQISVKEQEISNLNTRMKGLEEERVQLVAQYREAELKVRKLNNDLEGAVDQITELITQSESNSRLRNAVDRYQNFQQRSSSLIASGRTEDRDTARRELQNFLSSREVREIFPELSELYNSIQENR